MDAVEIIAERRIREAMDRGDFDNNPLAGKPLPPDGLDNVAPELRMVVKILRNAGIVPEEIELKKQILNLEGLLRICANGEEKVSLQLQISEKQLRYNILMERRTGKVFLPEYQARLMDKMAK
jgi:hypothetical protein